MPTLLILGGLGALGLYFYSQSSSSGGGSSAPTAAQLAASGLTSTTPAYGSPGNPIAPPVPGAYGTPATQNGTTPGTPAAATTPQGTPLFHTGTSDAFGNVITVDGAGNPYLLS